MCMPWFNYCTTCFKHGVIVLPLVAGELKTLRSAYLLLSYRAPQLNGKTFVFELCGLRFPSSICLSIQFNGLRWQASATRELEVLEFLWILKSDLSKQLCNTVKYKLRCYKGKQLQCLKSNKPCRGVMCSYKLQWFLFQTGNNMWQRITFVTWL